MRHLDEIAAPGTPERALLERIDPHRLPRHVAIIMDGNGRWAKARHLPRVEGHRAGIRAVRETVETVAELEVSVLTLYAFSTENWKRPRYEVLTLMGLLKEYLRSELETFRSNNLRFRPIGRIEELDASVRRELDHAVEATSASTGSLVQIALNYSGRQELTDVLRSAVAAGADGQLQPDTIDEAWVDAHLGTAGLPDPDLLVRTSGEQRISNFLLWQLAYAEIYFTPVLWPDFAKRDLLEAIVDFQHRERRFGGLPETEKGLFTPPGGLSAGS
ncbi:MAG: isoprenyl transferase [Acidobacteria bacterium]|jgi:undecaprenyl diphosphate synthase|nr:isoprenyl transferase [Acidobacteriota bacterium]